MSENGWKPDLYVLVRLINALYENGPMKRTNLQMAARLNYPTFSKYLDWMCHHNLTEVNNDGDTPAISLTKKGKDAKDAFVEWLSRVFEESY